MSYTFNSNNINPPVGSISFYLGTADTPGWILCDGQPRSNTNGIYNSLALLVGTKSSDGSTYTPPDLKGKLLKGSNTINTNGGSPSINLTSTQIPSLTITSSFTSTPDHAHILIDPGHQHYIGNLWNTGPGGGVGTNAAQGYNFGFSTWTGSASAQISINAANNNDAIAIESSYRNNSQTSVSILPPYYTINYIIKY